MNTMNVSKLLLEYNFVFKVHYIYLLVKMLHVFRKGNSVMLVPRLTLGSAIIPRLKNENYNIPPPKKKSKEDNKTQRQNEQRENAAV